MQSTDRIVPPARAAANPLPSGTAAPSDVHGGPTHLRLWVVTSVMAAAAAFWLLPVIWVLVTSLKITPDIVRLPPEWIPWPITIDHYREVLFGGSRTARIGRAFLNSTIISVGSVALVLVTSAMAAYPLARMRFPGRNVIFAALVGSLMVPNVVTLVPQYLLVQQFGWLSTFQGLIVPEAAVTLAFGVFLLRQFFLGIPSEPRRRGADRRRKRLAGLHANHPSVVPSGAGSAFDFAFRSAWNDFLWPLIAVNKTDMFPFPLRSPSYAALTVTNPMVRSWQVLC